MHRLRTGLALSLAGALSFAISACAQGDDAGDTAGATTGGAPEPGPCQPGQTSCADGKATWCRPDGTLDEYTCDAAQGLVCQASGCKGQCAHEELGPSYIGCDYYPTVTLNPVWSGFAFAVVVANTQSIPADVLITRGDATVDQRTVAANAVEVFELPWVAELKGGDFNAGGQIVDGSGATRLVAGGAYRLRSNVPVTVHQMSPLQYSLPTQGEGCPTSVEGTGCFSYSNDASLLLPVNALGRVYTAMAWHSKPMVAADQPGGPVNANGFITITATHDDTEIELELSGELSPGAGLAANGSGSVYLDAGDVLQIVAASGEPAIGFGKPQVYGPDVSGTRVHASWPVSVIAGNRCAFVPKPETGYCDHLEEAMFPTATLGRDYVVSCPAGPDNQLWPYVLRVAATTSGTKLHFDPQIAPDLVIEPGQPPFELAGLTTDVRVTADAPVIVAQYLQGATSLQNGGAEVPDEGDPAQSLAVPIEQFRNQTMFLTSTTYEQNFVNIVAPAGAAVTLDGALVGALAFSPVGDGAYGVARVPLAATDVHAVECDVAIGIVVYGYGKYTSYMVPGGLDLKRINEEPPPPPK